MNGTAGCAMGACTVATCNAGFGNCDGNAANGCETPTGNSPMHCGACGAACTLPNATPRCEAGRCAIASCNTGFADCDNDPSNGCEVDTRTTAAHCGGNCGGTCRNLNTDNTNCGACGIACGSGTTCVNGICESTTCLPTRPCSGTACDQCGTTSYSENWEAGSSGWRVNDGGALQLLSDTSTCRGTFMRETVLASGGRTFMQRGIPVRAGQVYCMAAWIRGSAGSQPFVGIYRGNAEGVSSGEHYWLIGAPCWPSGLGQTVSPVTSNGEWRWYAREFVMPNFTHAW
jgi:hypothetical protein